MSKILVSGSSSGLGKFLKESLVATPFSRDSDFSKIKEDKYDLIVHCAANQSRNLSLSQVYEYYLDNIKLTELLTSLDTKRFIYISSIDVSLITGTLGDKKQPNYFNQNNLYTAAKTFSEAIIKQFCYNYTILRCPYLLGKYMRNNTINKLINDERPTVSLSKDSIFNIIRYKDVFSFILKSMNDNINGTYEVVANKNISLFEIANHLKKEVKFGEHQYSVEELDNKKSAEILNELNLSSLQMLELFVGDNFE
jgi:dTDP-4-dehydrorhamnose reductase